MTDKDREAFEAWVAIRWRLVKDKPDLGGVGNQWTGEWCYTYAETSSLYAAWQAARDHYAPKLETLRICGLSAAEASRLHTWFESQLGRTFASFWEEAFDAGVKQAIALLAPKLTEAEAVEKAAIAIAGIRWDKVERPNGNTQSREEYAYYLREKWTDEAEAVLRAAGVRFREEA